MAKEFEKPEGFQAPGMSEMGASVLSYGMQSGDKDYVEPGSEGANAVRVQVGNGGIGSNSKGSSVSE
jgi:hypothetical protein